MLGLKKAEAGSGVLPAKRRAARVSEADSERAYEEWDGIVGSWSLGRNGT
jgi:hypothetical protein